MPNALYLLLFIFFSTLIPAQLSAAGKRPVAKWNYYHFDGSGFSSGPAVDGTVYVAVREKLRPVVLKTKTAAIEQIEISAGEGAVAGICYIQSSGGKLVSAKGFNAYPYMPLQISSGGKKYVTLQTDNHGYFVVVLPVGNYSIGNGTFAAEITVESGITKLIPLRVGKRMVD